MLKAIVNRIIASDSDLTLIIRSFVRPYAPYEQPPYFAALLPTFVKIIIYSLIVLTPLLFLKFFYPYKRLVSYIIYAILFICALSVFGIIMGFFQLAFTF